MSVTGLTPPQLKGLLEIARLPASGSSFAGNLEPVVDRLAGLVPFTRLSAVVTPRAPIADVAPGVTLEPAVPIPRQPLVYLRNYPPELLAAYEGLYRRSDVAAVKMPANPNRVFRTSDFVPHAEWERHEFCHEFVGNRLGCRYGAGALLELPAALVMSFRLWRRDSDGDFTPVEVKSLELILHDVARLSFAGILAQAIRAPGASTGSEPNAGFVIVDRAGELRYADPRATRLAERMVAPRTLPAILAELVRRSRDDDAAEREQLVPLMGGGWLAIDLHDAHTTVGEVVALLRVIASRGDSRPALDGFGLTPREKEAAQLAVMGLGNREIAGRLGLSPITVKIHLSSVYKKVAVQGRTELAAIALGGRLGYGG